MVLTASSLKSQVFWDVMLCRWMDSFRRFERWWFLHRQGQTVSDCA